MLGLVSLGLSVLPAAEPPTDPAPKALFLHYRWHKDGSISLVSRQEIPARLKPSRSAADRSAEPAVPETRPRIPFRPAAGGPAALSYVLINAKGDTLGETALPDPRIQRVEYAVKGEPGLRSHVVVQDSGDIFLRIAEPEARALRFYRWHATAPRGIGMKSSAASASAEPVKTPLAEFELR